MPQKELPIRVGMSSMEEGKKDSCLTHLCKLKKKKSQKRQEGFIECRFWYKYPGNAWLQMESCYYANRDGGTGPQKAI